VALPLPFAFLPLPFAFLPSHWDPNENPNGWGLLKANQGLIEEPQNLKVSILFSIYDLASVNIG